MPPNFSFATPASPFNLPPYCSLYRPAHILAFSNFSFANPLIVWNFEPSILPKLPKDPNIFPSLAIPLRSSSRISTILATFFGTEYLSGSSFPAIVDFSVCLSPPSATTGETEVSIEASFFLNGLNALIFSRRFSLIVLEGSRFNFPKIFPLSCPKIVLVLYVSSFCFSMPFIRAVWYLAISLMSKIFFLAFVIPSITSVLNP